MCFVSESAFCFGFGFYPAAQRRAGAHGQRSLVCRDYSDGRRGPGVLAPERFVKAEAGWWVG